MNFINEAWVKQHVQHRVTNGHKKSFGHVLVIAGSDGKEGAAILCAKAALHNGCGMVTAMVPHEAVHILLSQCPEIMHANVLKVEHLALDSYDAIVIGPGLGFSDIARENLTYIIANFKGSVVIDADALTMLSGTLNTLNENHILTPHPGEFSRLTGQGYTEKNREKLVSQFVEQYTAVLVLKGSGTLVAKMGEEILQNTTGNDGMATAGSGDVLAGMIGALCAQGYDNFQAAAIGVYLHGKAGDEAVKEISKASLVASDIILQLGKIRIID